MKRIVHVVFLTSALGGLLFLPAVLKRSGAVVQASSGCSLATLNGNYGFTLTGFTTPSVSPTGNEVPAAVVGVLKFDGAGGVSASSNSSFNGATGDEFLTGTYTVNANCTGSMSFPSAEQDFATVILGAGSELIAIGTNTGSTFTVDAKKQ